MVTGGGLGSLADYFLTFHLAFISPPEFETTDS